PPRPSARPARRRPSSRRPPGPGRRAPPSAHDARGGLGERAGVPRGVSVVIPPPFHPRPHGSRPGRRARPAHGRLSPVSRDRRPRPPHRPSMTWTAVPGGVRGRERLSPLLDFVAVLAILLVLLGGSVWFFVWMARTEGGVT